MLEIKQVTRNYGTLVAVDNVSFTVRPGEIFGLLGTNGAGKTTTFRMITGLLKPTKGEILYNNKPMDYSNSDEIGLLLEERALFPKLTVLKQMIFFGRLKSMTEEKIIKELDYWLERLNIRNYKHKKVKELSKGNQQKIQLIASIIHNPKILILDEPFSGLDPLNIEKFIEIIREFQKRKAIIVFSTHRIDHVELFCEELLVLEKGKAILRGNIEKIKEDFERKTIRICGQVNKEELEKIPGVLKVVENLNEFVLSVSSNAVSSLVFDYVKTCENISKYSLEKPTLNEIFIEKVGVYNE